MKMIFKAVSYLAIGFFIGFAGSLAVLLITA